MTIVRDVFTRVAAIALLLSAVDAVSGRLLQAHPNPSLALSLGATAWIAYRLGVSGHPRLAVPAGVTLWIIYMGAFVVWAWLLVGWNGSRPWRPESATWVVAVAIAAPVIALVAQLTGSSARRASARRAAAPNDQT